MKRNKHNLGHYRLFTGDMGMLYPVGCMEVLPGDTFQHQTSLIVRLQPMAAPVMHPIDVRLHHFFVPNRIIWEGWEDFITGGPDNGDTSEIPTVAYSDAFEGFNALDYLGVPPVSGLEVNALPLWAYVKIFNEFYRDQDLEVEVGANSQQVRRIAWEKDYFTSARPWEQKGDDITIPVGEKAPVLGIGTELGSYVPSSTELFMSDGTNQALGSAQDISAQGWYAQENPDHPGFPNLYADLSQASAVSINEFRRAFALQRYSEARARYGSRYTEYLRYLGVNSSDARLQRPEYLGGGRQTVSISEVLQTAPENDQGQPPGSTEYGVGDMYGHGISALRSNRYRRFFEEHGYVISLASVRPKAMYTQGLDRHWLKRDKEDYWQKELQFIGQQPLYNGEVYADGTPDDLQTFGYQDRYIEYKRAQSYVSGEFRNLQNYWHLGREFSQRPVLNNNFIRCEPSKRIFNEQTQHSLWCAAQHRVVARRMVKKSNASRII